MSQMTLLAGELWFWVISHDLQMGYQNPFSSFKQNKTFYVLVVGILSIGSGIILIGFGPSAYGVSAEGAIWIQDRSDSVNSAKLVLFYIPMAFIYCYCAYTIYSLTMKLSVGFGETLGIRVKIMQRSRTYIIGYMIFWYDTILNHALFFR